MDPGPTLSPGRFRLGITGSFCALAETGTIVLLSGEKEHATTSLLPETHVAVVSRKRIVVSMEDVWDLVRTEVGKLPRQVNFVSGPSRTADIEMTLVYGAHGPFRVHIILTDDIMVDDLHAETLGTNRGARDAIGPPKSGPRL